MADDQALISARGRVGRVLREKYRLDRVLGVGGMAAVYLATHRNTKQFAVKMLHPELSIREALRTRFLREGYVANSVKHPGAVAVMDDDVAEDGSAFLVMELLIGSPVDELWALEGKRMPAALVLSIADAVLDVLTAAHERGIVHRDLKPANLFLTSDGALKVLDFGIARLLDDGGASATLTGTMLGTPAFMAPEQALSRASAIDAQTDLWAVGATMFALLSGHLAHEGDNASQVLVNAATKAARSLGTALPEAHPALVALVDKALAFEKKDRWETAAAMREALRKSSGEITGGSLRELPKIRSADSEALTSAPRSVPDSSDAAFAPTVGDAAPVVTPPPKAGTTTAGPVATTGPTRPSPEVREARRVRLRAGLSLLLAATVIVGGTAGYRFARAPHLRPCADAVDTQDGPRCVAPLAKLAAPRHAGRTAGVTDVLGHVTSVDWVSLGGGGPGEEDLYREDVTRDRDGHVEAIVRRDPHGRILRWEKWSDGGHRVDLVDIDGTTPRADKGTSITTLRRELSPGGQVVKEMYFGKTGRPRPDARGRYGVRFEYGRSPRWVKSHVLAADGGPGVDRHGMAEEDRADDETPEGREATHFDSAGKPLLIDGAFRARRTYDEAMNLTETRLFGLQDEPAVDVALGWSSHHQKWDADSRTLEVFQKDEHGHVRPEKGQSSSVRRTTYDPKGHAVLEEYLDGDRNRIRGRGGEPAARRTKWNDAGLAVEHEELDTDGTLTPGRGGYARRVVSFDERGMVGEQRYFDPTGRPTLRKDGGAITRETRDERGLVRSVVELDADGGAAVDVHGVHERRRSWDAARHLVMEALYGLDGHPTTDEEGVSVTRSTYDDHDDLTRVAFFDEAGIPIMVQGELAAERFTCDERGLRVSAEALDAHGDPTLRKEGYALVRYERDRNGDVLSESYFGKHGEKIACTGGYARKTFRYDAHRRPVETALFDTAGVATRGDGGWAVLRTTYDDRGLVTRESRLDASGKPVDSDRGAAISRTWDPRGNLIAETTLGADDRPKVTSAGYAIRRNEYDDKDQLVGEQLLMPDGTAAKGRDGWSERRIRYDDVGNVVEESYFDGAHAPVMPRGASYASIRHRFDGMQRLVETSYLDGTGAPARGSEGVALVRYQRDAYGRAISTSYFDGAGVPTATRDGKVVLRSTYDPGGRLIEERSLDATGVLRPLADGCSVRQTKYDAHGRKVEDVCRDIHEELATSTDGFAIQRIVYDGRGNGVDIATYGPDGQLTLDREGIARRRNRYSEQALVIATTYFDAADRPTHDKAGVHETRFAYDEAGKPLPASYFDEHGHPVFPEAVPGAESGHVDLAFGDDRQR